MLKILSVVGARPQFVKAAVVSRCLRASPDVQEILVHTGQHYDDNMSAIFFETMGIPSPDHNLGIGSGLHGAQTGRMLESIERVLIAERPDLVLVYGDTNSTLAGALAASKLHIPVAHVEAGLRSGNRLMPEEQNRIVTDHLASMLFAPSEASRANLEHEGVKPRHIYVVGDVMYDAALYYGQRAGVESSVLERHNLSHRGFVLATVHRAENTDDLDRLRAIMGGLCHVAARLPVVMPLHPRTLSVLRADRALLESAEHLCVLEPIGYIDMVRLEQSAALIATDSGGVQKEAFFFGVPCRTLRHETEWVELLELGWNALVPPSSPRQVADGLLAALGTTGRAGNPYGDGSAATRIRDAVRSSCPTRPA